MRSKQEASRLRVKFWGVRGSTPTPQRENLGFGGNTSCLEVRGAGDEILIFDGGTGLRQLGIALLKEFKKKKFRAHFFFTHCHWDHIQGIPFFDPLYRDENEVVFYAPPTPNDLRGVLMGQMATPYFPVNFESVAIKRSFVQLESGPVKCGGLTIHSFPVNHPQGAVGYRVESAGKAMVYATDMEAGNERLDGIVRDFSQNADLLIHDAQYTDQEIKMKRGWGHSTWGEAVQAAKDAKAGQLILFHHDPSHDDQFVREIVKKARRKFDHTKAAREGWFVEL